MLDGSRDVDVEVLAGSCYYGNMPGFVLVLVRGVAVGTVVVVVLLVPRGTDYTSCTGAEHCRVEPGSNPHTIPESSSSG